MEIQQTKDTIVDNLTSTEGKKLHIMSNIKSTGQAMMLMENFIGASLGSRFAAEEMEFLMQLTVSWQGDGRTDLKEIGKTPDVQGWKQNNTGE